MTTAQAGVLELWNVTLCTELPATGYTVFQAPTLYQATSAAPSAWSTRQLLTPSWVNQNYVGSNPFGTCSLSVATTSSGGTSITY
jgi:hypothetical protein